ncbi:MAG TPA: 1-phosphofructokinase family hexose kinase [Fimbriimonadaceae bacterium]|nr:1-phosphofructokinase family hexose kinase [Fimbriimonadaceae bacterium]
MILTVTLNPSIDRTLFVDGLKLGDTNRVVRTEVDAGGKGLNLSRVAAELGGTTLATGFLGAGPGQVIRSVLEAEGVAFRMTEVAESTRVNISVEAGDGPPTTLNERGPHISSDELNAFLSTFGACLEQFEGWVCLCGSVPPSVDKAIYRQLGLMAKSAGWKVFLDADGELLRNGLEAKPDLIKPNTHEASRLLGRTIVSDDDAFQAASELLGSLSDDGVVVISQGKDGAVLVSEELRLKGISPSIEPCSTIGSGDSMIGGLLAALERGSPWDAAFRWGLAAGAATATTNGSEIARLGVVELLFDQARVVTV